MGNYFFGLAGIGRRWLIVHVGHIFRRRQRENLPSSTSRTHGLIFPKRARADNVFAAKHILA